jgi:hypothetical protein
MWSIWRKRNASTFFFLISRNASTFAGTKVLLLEMKSIFFRLLFNWIRAIGGFSLSSYMDFF